ncbi:hypothetical protein PoB_004355500 [Plakobranchus ocellatus]|uniref:Uncharacterized protein n=1 Tax=Plakobranchus ocellatus TaxID=259542 RepID=A0AAV4B8Z1_9GAST|nr:hypothetical protein PoB_004355500 [Plakobranchus ocellatus]
MPPIAQQMCFYLIVLLAITPESLTSPVQEDKGHVPFERSTATNRDWQSPLTSQRSPSLSDKADITTNRLEQEIFEFLGENGYEVARTSVQTYTTGTSTDKDSLEKELEEFIAAIEEEDEADRHKSENTALKDLTSEAIELESLASSRTDNPPTYEVSKGTEKDVTSTSKPVFENSGPDDVSSEPVSTLGESSIISTKLVLIVGVTAAALLLILLVAVLLYWYRPKPSQKNKMLFNPECNRWDPQLLRPTQKNIDAFMFGTPIPSISEMIKYQDDNTSLSN